MCVVPAIGIIPEQFRKHFSSEERSEIGGRKEGVHTGMEGGLGGKGLTCTCLTPDP